MPNPFKYPLFQAIDGDGNPIDGGKLYTYEAGTTTPKVAYTDKDLTVPAANPVILDSKGEATIYLDGTYKIDLKTSADVQVDGFPIDNIESDFLSFSVYETIAALRAATFTPAANQVVTVLGYYSANDGGGGQFYWDSTSTETDDNGTIIKVTSITTGRWNRDYNGTLHVDWFGAYGDGSTDDSTTIQAVITGFPGYTIEFDPSKIYWIDTGLTINDRATSLYAGASSSTLLKSDQDIYMLTIDDCLDVLCTNIGMYNTHGSPTKACVLMAGKAKVARFQYCQFRGQKYNVLFDGAQGTDPGGIFYNEFYQCAYVGPTDENIYFTDAPGMNENKFIGGQVSNTSSNKMLRVTGNNNQFIGGSWENVVSGNNYEEFTVYEYGLNVFLNNRFEVDGHGIYVDNDSATPGNGTIIANNYWACNTVRVMVVDGVCLTDTYGAWPDFRGVIEARASVNTTVDVQSVSGQKVVSVSGTADIQVGDPIVLNPGNSGEEFHIVASFSAGVSITTLGNLVNTHEVGETVQGWNGKEGITANINNTSTDISARGIQVASFDATPGGSDNSSMLLLDVDEGVVKQVSFGADDGAGSGFKVLRVAN